MSSIPNSDFFPKFRNIKVVIFIIFFLILDKRNSKEMVKKN